MKKILSRIGNLALDLVVLVAIGGFLLFLAITFFGEVLTEIFSGLLGG